MNIKKTIQSNYSWVVLGMGTLAVFGALGLARFGYSIVLPAMQENLGMDNAQAGFLAAVNLIGYLALSIIGGALASRYGIRLIASIGLLIAGLGMIFTGLSPGFFSIAVWRGFTGIGSGAANVAVMGLWSAWFSKSRRGLASGIAVSGSSIALIVTGLFVPWITAGFGVGAWRNCWFIYGGLTLLLAIGTYTIIRNSPDKPHTSATSHMSHAPATSHTLDMSHTPGTATQRRTFSKYYPGSGNQQVPVSGARSVEKIQWKRVYFSLQVWHLGFVYIAFGFSYIIYMTFFARFLTTDCAYTQTEAGRLFMLMGWFSMLCGLIWGMISDRTGRKNALVIIYLVHTAAFALFALGNSPFYFTLSAVLFGLSAWSIPAVMAVACGDILGPKMAPAALGFITLFFGIGQATGPVVAGLMADAAGEFSPVFLLASAVALLGAAGSAFLKDEKGRSLKTAG